MSDKCSCPCHTGAAMMHALPCCGPGSSSPPMTPPRGEPMPQTIEHYKANALRDQELILDMRTQTSKDSMTINKYRQRESASLGAPRPPNKGKS